MHIHIISLFPKSIEPYMESSIMKRAQEKGLFRYTIHNLADWSVRNTRRVDDRPYGGGAGTIITIEPLYNILEDLSKKYLDIPIYLMSPAGEILTQELLENNMTLTHNRGGCIIICGHYEGIDERIFSLFSITPISLGAYVLSSGEVASLVFIDGMVRLLPGVINNESLKEESFSKELERKKEYPQYSRPEEFRGLHVPMELLSGNHEVIKKWKKAHIR